MNARNTYPGRCAGFRDWAQKLVDALDNVRPPAHGICDHHGLHFFFRGLTVQLTTRGCDTLLILSRTCKGFDRREALGRKGFAGMRQRTFKRLADCVATAMGAPIAETWNGGDGCTSGSFVLHTCRWPWLHHAIDNYRALPSVFSLTEEQRAAFAAFKNSMPVGVNRMTLEQRPKWQPINQATISRGGRKIHLQGPIFVPADFPQHQRAAAYQTALGRLKATASLMLPGNPDCRDLQLSTTPPICE